MRTFDLSRDDDAMHEANRGNRRRLRVFQLIFAAVLLPGMVWNITRPDEFQATARLRIAPGSTSPHDVAPTPAASPVDEVAFLTQVQLLTARPLVHKVAEQAQAAGLLPPANSDPADALQKMIGATPVAGTQVVELRAVGTSAQLTAFVVNALVEAYGEQAAVRFEHAEAGNHAQVRDEVDRLTEAVDAKRKQIEAFRSQSGLISSERAENLALSSLTGLNNALNNALDRAAAADGRVRALRESGTPSRNRGGGAKDDPTLASLEQRASALREEFRDMERRYTADFLAMDPQARALRTRIADLESQIAEQRGAGRDKALSTAEEDAATARAAVERLRDQIAAAKSGAQDAAARVAQAKALEDDLAQIQQTRRDALAKLARVEASQLSRQPVLELVEPASVPTEAFRPDRLRDGGLILAAAFALGLVGIGFVELFNRRPPPAAAAHTVIMPPPWTGGSPGLPPLAHAAAPTALPHVAHAAHAPQPLPVFPAQQPDPTERRELTQDEIAALLAVTRGTARFACAALLSGVSETELLALRQCDLSPDTGVLRLGGAAPRALTVPAWLTAGLPGGSETPVLHHPTGAGLTPRDVHSMLVAAALDAGLEQASAVDAELLRHTAVAWLVRQGVRFSELAGLTGPIEADVLSAYAYLAPRGDRASAGVEGSLAMPALQTPPA